jgi:hypothetical protein
VTSNKSRESGVDLVVSFLRSPMMLARDQRAIFQRALPASELADHLRRGSLNLRDNVARIFIAARLAERHDAPLLFAEGWRCHAIARRATGTHHVTGSHMACLLLRMLQRRGLADPRIRVLRKDASRCTLQEVASVQETASSLGGALVLGVAGRACPSRRRAARYFHLRHVMGARVHDCWGELAAWRSVMTREECELALALQPSTPERVREILFEGTNWMLHLVSRAEELLRRPPVPLEVRLAHRLRRDAAPESDSKAGPATGPSLDDRSDALPADSVKGG